ncbi:MAG: hypothetical protein Q9195_007255 [Heterodermia aff. obscurata]
MTTPWALISPASRGIGLELARRLLQTTDLHIVATARNDLQRARSCILEGTNVDDGRLEVLRVDVTGIFPRSPFNTSMNHWLTKPADESSIISAAKFCGNRFRSTHLHLAFLVPGILHPERSPSQISASQALATLQINSLGPLLLAKHFIPFLPKQSTALPLLRNQMANLPSHAVMALMSARVGSISDNKLGGWYSYRASKAAVNSIARSIDVFLQQKARDKAMCVAMHPGTVKTSLSEEFWSNVKEDKLFSADFAAERLIEVVKDLNLEDRGKCWDWEGKEIAP